MEVRSLRRPPPIDAPRIGNVTQGVALGNGAYEAQARSASAGELNNGGYSAVRALAWIDILPPALQPCRFRCI